MAAAPGAPFDDLAHVAGAEERLLEEVRGLGDRDLVTPSLLPGWTLAHLLTHLARNADSHRHRTAGAVEGVVVDQYPGGTAQRAADIEAGVGRPAGEVIADLATASTRMLEAWMDAPSYAWAGITRDSGGNERPLRQLPGRRWLEVEVHLVDLGTGPTHRDWPDAFVAARLPGMRADMARRLPDGAVPPPAGSLDGRDELAWLYGRLRRDDLPVLAPWA
ncbi:MAG: maleylpyruvate isomerase N-terminal domain-containing protein [Acidimicrobiales bacterium]|jgi:maleylpyruvate isomerase